MVERKQFILKMEVISYKVDGYAEINTLYSEGLVTKLPKIEKIVYQFHGCYFHGCPKCFKSDTINPTRKLQWENYIIQQKGLNKK